MPKISIIVPVYNAEVYLNRCLTALMAQTFRDIEILCINDGSTDRSPEILHEYAAKDSRIKVFDQENSGPATSRNVGLRNASGKYIMFCDSDDWYETDMCEHMYNCIEIQNVDIVMCDCNIIEMDKSHGRPSNSVNYHYIKYKEKQNITSGFKTSLNTLLWNKIFKRDIIAQYGIAFPDGYERDDKSFMRQYLAVSVTYYGLALELYNYSLRSGSVMSCIYAQKRTEKLFDHIYAFEFTCQYLQRHSLAQKNIKFIEDSLLKDIAHVFGLLENRADRIRFLALVRERIIPFFPAQKKFYSHIVEYINNREYNKAINYIERRYLGVRSWLGLKIQKIKSGALLEYKIGTISIYKETKSERRKRYYVFNIKIFSKAISRSIKDNQINSKFFQNAILQQRQYYDGSDKIVLLFDCLYDRYAEAIDAYTFFEYLQSRNIPSKYILLTANPLYAKLKYLNNLNNIETVDDQYQLFTKHLSLIAQSNYIITSFGLQGETSAHILSNLPSIKNIYIGHGVMLLKEWVLDRVYTEEKYPYRLVPTKHTLKLYQCRGWKTEGLIHCLLPRWDKLRKSTEHKQKNIFVFFTWRKAFEKEQLTDYIGQIFSLLYNQRLLLLLSAANIRLNLALHHSIKYNNYEFPYIGDHINIVRTDLISNFIAKADLFITDYSSLLFDFMFLNTPVISYRLDYAIINKLSDYDRRGLESAMKYDDILYNCVYNEEDVIALIEHYIKNNFTLEPANKAKNDAFFYSKDNICETLYNKMLELS
jgi:glycosyltransferase involved in cell wall biosynthesis